MSRDLQTTKDAEDIAHEVMLGTSSIADICDAYGKGFDQSGRGLKNPYAPESGEHTAYQYGILMGAGNNGDRP